MSKGAANSSGEAEAPVELKTAQRCIRWLVGFSTGSCHLDAKKVKLKAFNESMYAGMQMSDWKLTFYAQQSLLLVSPRRWHSCPYCFNRG